MDFKSFLIALEASEDITREVQDELNEDTPPDEENDIGRTDNIFGADEGGDSSDSPDDTPTDEESSEDTDDIDGMDDGVDTNAEEDITEEDGPINPEITKKVNLRKNMILLHNILDSNIDTLLSYNPSQNIEESSKILYAIIDNLTECKKILFNEIVDNFSTKSYASLLKTYIAVNRVYELAQKSLEKYFDGITIETPKKQKKMNKTYKQKL